ncbi:M4 family metallopeptidase [Psychroserpens sp.]|uniref:M4 family metallopeptidase n=1 Tax=Psychroserpens sp. TaxID=2020870 RepID=UPI002B26801B|nr:M4 family metallopeptidase [Psychroserpens sp.]
MKKIKFILLLQLVVSIVYAQDKSLSASIDSRFVNEEGVVQFVKFDEASKLNFENRSNLLQEFFESPEHTKFVKVDSKTDKIGILHETFQQYFNAIPVEFGIYKAHLKNKMISAINGDYFPITDINTAPTISESNAISIAKGHVNSTNFYESLTNKIGYDGPKPTLVVFPKMKNITTVDRLAFRLDIYAEKPLYRADVYVDAHTGEVFFENNKIHHTNAQASGTTVYNNTQDFTADQILGGYRLRETTSTGSGIQTFNATNGVQNATDIISSTANFNNINNAAVQVHWGTEKAYDYFFQEHNRNSFDDNAALIKSYITPQTINANAYWTGDVLHYSAGNTQNIGPLTSLDIVGHEFSHAVVDHTADLIYSNQSGAINESYADIFGEMVEHHALGSNDWLCGADVFNSGLRSMSNPKTKLHPDTYLGEYWQTTSNDNFGVHSNSGVHNKWFYLLAVGGTGTNDNGLSYSVNGIGIQKAAEIAYRNLTLYLTPTSNYNYTVETSIYAAIQLFGPNSPEHIATAQAWQAVGLLIQPTDYISPTTPINLVATNTTSNYVISGILSWDASTDNVGVLGYNIYRNGSLIGVSDTTSYNVPQNMLSNTMYDFRVQAFDAAGKISGLSNIDSIWYDTTGPTAPTNLTSSNTTETTTDLNWTASTDGIGVVGYKIYNGLVYLETVTNTSHTLTNLTPNTNYNFRVVAFDAAGFDSNSSNTVNVLTPITIQCTGGNGNLTLTINFSNTSNSNSYFYFWEIIDATTNSVVEQEYYFSPPGNSTLIETIAIGPGSYYFDFFDYSSPAAVQDFELVGSSQVIIPSTGLTNNMYFSLNPFCVSASGNRVTSNTIKSTISNTKRSGTIYPNPVLDRLHYRNLNNENKAFLIVDLTGKIFMKGMLDSEKSIDVSLLKSGLYILRIVDKENTEYHKFIKK